MDVALELDQNAARERLLKRRRERGASKGMSISADQGEVPGKQPQDTSAGTASQSDSLSGATVFAEAARYHGEGLPAADKGVHVSTLAPLLHPPSSISPPELAPLEAVQETPQIDVEAQQKPIHQATLPDAASQDPNGASSEVKAPPTQPSTLQGTSVLVAERTARGGEGPPLPLVGESGHTAVGGGGGPLDVVDYAVPGGVVVGGGARGGRGASGDWDGAVQQQQGQQQGQQQHQQRKHQQYEEQQQQQQQQQPQKRIGQGGAALGRGEGVERGGSMSALQLGAVVEALQALCEPALIDGKAVDALTPAQAAEAVQVIIDAETCGRTATSDLRLQSGNARERFAVPDLSSPALSLIAAAAAHATARRCSDPAVAARVASYIRQSSLDALTRHTRSATTTTISTKATAASESAAPRAALSEPTDSSRVTTDSFHVACEGVSATPRTHKGGLSPRVLGATGERVSVSPMETQSGCGRSSPNAHAHVHSPARAGADAHPHAHAGAHGHIHTNAPDTPTSVDTSCVSSLVGERLLGTPCQAEGALEAEGTFAEAGHPQGRQIGALDGSNGAIDTQVYGNNGGLQVRSGVGQRTRSAERTWKGRHGGGHMSGGAREQARGMDKSECSSWESNSAEGDPESGERHDVKHRQCSKKRSRHRADTPDRVLSRLLDLESSMQTSRLSSLTRRLNDLEDVLLKIKMHQTDITQKDYQGVHDLLQRVHGLEVKIDTVVSSAYRCTYDPFQPPPPQSSSAARVTPVAPSAVDAPQKASQMTEDRLCAIETRLIIEQMNSLNVLERMMELVNRMRVSKRGGNRRRRARLREHALNGGDQEITQPVQPVSQPGKEGSSRHAVRAAQPSGLAVNSPSRKRSPRRTQAVVDVGSDAVKRGKGDPQQQKQQQQQQQKQKRMSLQHERHMHSLHDERHTYPQQQPQQHQRTPKAAMQKPAAAEASNTPTNAARSHWPAHTAAFKDPRHNSLSPPRSNTSSRRTSASSPTRTTATEMVRRVWLREERIADVREQCCMGLSPTGDLPSFLVRSRSPEERRRERRWDHSAFNDRDPFVRAEERLRACEAACTAVEKWRDLVVEDKGVHGSHDASSYKAPLPPPPAVTPPPPAKGSYGSPHAHPPAVTPPPPPTPPTVAAQRPLAEPPTRTTPPHSLDCSAPPTRSPLPYSTPDATVSNKSRVHTPIDKCLHAPPRDSPRDVIQRVTDRQARIASIREQGLRCVSPTGELPDHLVRVRSPVEQQMERGWGHSRFDDRDAAIIAEERMGVVGVSSPRAHTPTHLYGSVRTHAQQHGSLRVMGELLQDGNTHTVPLLDHPPSPVAITSAPVARDDASIVRPEVVTASDSSVSTGASPPTTDAALWPPLQLRPLADGFALQGVVETCTKPDEHHSV